MDAHVCMCVYYKQQKEDGTWCDGYGGDRLTGKCFGSGASSSSLIKRRERERERSMRERMLLFRN